jgi:hypothetical protein
VKRLLALLVFAGLCAGSASALAQRAPLPFADLPRAEIQVVTASGRHDFKVWIADNDQSRARGLMFVRELPAGYGMLFLFEEPQFASFWMKNTYLSLDIIFIAPDGVVVNIAHNTPPLSFSTIESIALVKGVLELVAGTADRIGLVTGDRIVHRAFAMQQAE